MPLRKIARRKSISFNITSKVQDLTVWFDVNILDKVMFNLLSNAFKFTNENGSINVVIDKDPSGRKVLITVQDSGVGMLPDEVDHAFELFYQGHKKAFKGTGLGLSLTKEMIHLIMDHCHPERQMEGVYVYDQSADRQILFESDGDRHGKIDADPHHMKISRSIHPISARCPLTRRSP